MNTENFNKIYEEKGGFELLEKMVHSSATQKTIANYFGVSGQRVKQWVNEMFGINYDPRKFRKMKKINDMKTLIEEIGIESVKRMYSNRYYVKKAEEELKTK